MKLFLNLFKSNKVQQVVNEAKQALLRTETIKTLPGRKASRAVFGDMLVITEEEMLSSTSKKISTAVYANRGAHIGKGGSEGLEVFREKIITRKPNESLLGGDVIEINKDYHSTMAHTGRKEMIIKEHLPNGCVEHIEKKVTYDNGYHTESVIDNTKSLVTGKSLYSMKVDEMKANEAAQEAAKARALQEAQEALQKAELERIAKYPHVNVGKVFNKNIEEFRLVNEKVKPNGEIVREFSAKSKTGANQYIITRDIGTLHEEHIIDPEKDIDILYQYINDGNYGLPSITMRRGLSYRQIDNKCIYNDGINRYETNSLHEVFDKEVCGILSGKLKNEYDELYRNARTDDDFRAVHKKRDELNRRMLEIRKDMRENCYVDLHDLFRPFRP